MTLLIFLWCFIGFIIAIHRTIKEAGEITLLDLAVCFLFCFAMIPAVVVWAIIDLMIIANHIVLWKQK